MKKDLGRSYGGEQISATKPNDVHYPSTTLESEDALDIPKDLINRDIDVKMRIRIVRVDASTDKKGTKQRLDIEFRKIDFGDQIQEKDIQDDIADAIEGINESAADENAEGED